MGLQIRAIMLQKELTGNKIKLPNDFFVLYILCHLEIYEYMLTKYIFSPSVTLKGEQYFFWLACFKPNFLKKKKFMTVHYRLIYLCHRDEN